MARMVPTTVVAALLPLVAGGLLPVSPVHAAAPPTLAAQAATCRTGQVSLTFDDGPAPGVTPRLLGVLRRRNVPAVFFMVGQRVAAAPGIARQVERSGSLVANHSYRHQDMRTQTSAQIRATIRSTYAELGRAGVHPLNLVRPPYGGIDAHVTEAIRDTDSVPVLWDVDPRDWAGGSSAQIAARVLAQLRPGANIVLLHDGVANSPSSVGAVPRIVRRARQRGYCFVALDEGGRPGFPTPEARLSVSPENRKVREGSRLRVTVTLSRPAGRATSVHLRLDGRTASPARDLDRPPNVVRVPAGRLSAAVSILALRDRLDERTERFEVRLTRPDGVRLDRASSTVRIIDRDRSPTLSGQDTGVVEPVVGSVPVPVTFRLDRSSGKEVRMSVQTVAGTADSSDFTPVSGTVVIPAGERTGTVTVSVLADTAVEPPETFTVHISSARNARVKVADAVVTINPPAP